MAKNKTDYTSNITTLTAQEIADGIRAKIVTFVDLQNTELFENSKQRQVKALLAQYEKEDIIAQRKEEQTANQQKIFDEIKKNINAKTPDLVKKDLGENGMRQLCCDIGIDYNIVNNYNEPPLKFSPIIPQTEDEIPSGYTDVFFWGIPASGKTCALSAILNTMNKKYVIDAPEIKKQFGGTYRDSLVGLFEHETGYLPSATRRDRTQYMPFRLKKRGEKELYRNIAFFELSGEIFEFIYDIVNNDISTNLTDVSYNTDEEHLTEEQKKEKEKRIAFNTLNLLLNSNNQKIHFFFIDYNQAEHKREEQAKYLSAAATYFRDRNNIFRERTDAVYVVVTKADEIEGENDSERSARAGAFLDDNFGSFMDVIKNRCNKDSIDFGKKIFSIGDVYFSKICKINRKYSIDIIDDLIRIVQPSLNEYKWYYKLFKFFNKA
jgi:hypothetical protein